MCESLFSLSQNLRKKMMSLNKKVNQIYGDKIKLVEYITLPDFGQKIILRYELIGNVKSKEELNNIELGIENLLEEKYMVTLIGDVFYKYGFNPKKLPVTFKKINEKYTDDIINNKKFKYSNEIKNDAEIIKSMFDLPKETKIWEIELSTNEKIFEIRIISKINYDNFKVNLNHIDGKVIFLEKDKSYKGALKSYYAARKNNLALTNYLINEQT